MSSSTRSSRATRPRSTCSSAPGSRGRPTSSLAVTGDDEDNIVICQIAKEKYGVPKVIARVNDPRNQAHFDLLGISPTVSATSTILALVEHEVPEHGLIHLLELRNENLEIVEVQIEKSSPVRREDGRRPGAAAGIAADLGRRATDSPRSRSASTKLLPGDRVLAILKPGREEEFRRALFRG